MAKNIYKIGKELFITSDEEIKEGDWNLPPSNIPVKHQGPKFKGDEPLKCWKKIILTTDQDLIADGVQKIDDDFLEWFVNNPSCEQVEVKKVEFEVDMGLGDSCIEYGNYYKIIIPKEEPKSIKEKILSETSEETKKKVRDYGNSLVEKQETLNINKNTHYVDFSNPNADKISSASTTTIKQETLEEAAERILNLSELDGFRDYHYKQELYTAFIVGIKYQQKRSYNEEEVLNILYKHTEDLLSNKKVTLEKWFEQFKKK